MEAAGPERSSDGLLTVGYLKDTLLSQLRTAGCAMPSRRSLEDALAAGLEDLPTKRVLKHDRRCFSWAHLLNMVWGPVVDYLDSAAEGEPVWTKQLAWNHSMLNQEMQGIIAACDEPMEMDMWVEYIRGVLLKLLKVDVPTQLILQVVSPVVPFHLQPTPANGLHLLRSGLCGKLVGPALGAQTNRLVLAQIAELPVNLFPEPELGLKVRQELVDALALQAAPEDEEHESPQKKRRTRCAKETTMAAKTRQVLYMVENMVPVSRVHGTVTAASELLQRLQPSSSTGTSQPQAVRELVKRSCLSQHLLLLDGAWDRSVAEGLMLLRNSGSFAGVALATDESPPSQPRFRGLRFQITVIYLGTFLDKDLWGVLCRASPPEEELPGRHHALPWQKGHRCVQNHRQAASPYGLELLRRGLWDRRWGRRERRTYRCACLLREPEPRLRSPQVPAPHRLEDLRCGHSGLRPHVQDPVSLSGRRSDLGALEAIGHETGA